MPNNLNQITMILTHLRVNPIILTLLWWGSIKLLWKHKSQALVFSVRLLYFEPWDPWELFDIHRSSFGKINIIKKSLPQNIFAASTRIFAAKNVSQVTVETLCNILKGNVQIAFCDFWWVLIISQSHSQLEAGSCDTKTMQTLVRILGS